MRKIFLLSSIVIAMFFTACGSDISKYEKNIMKDVNRICKIRFTGELREACCTGGELVFRSMKNMDTRIHDLTVDQFTRKAGEISKTIEQDASQNCASVAGYGNRKDTSDLMACQAGVGIALSSAMIKFREGWGCSDSVWGR